MVGPKRCGLDRLGRRARRASGHGHQDDDAKPRPDRGRVQNLVTWAVGGSELPIPPSWMIGVSHHAEPVRERRDPFGIRG